MKLIKPAHAAIDLGEITGIGKYQETASGSPITGTQEFISVMVGVLTAVAGIAFLIYFIIGALTWVTSGGEKGKVESAQKTMTNAAIGLVAVIVAYFIAGIVGTVLDIPILNPAEFL